MNDPKQGVYGISVAGELVGSGIQNLRLYEERGLIEPARTPAGTRLYSEDDIERLKRITALLGEGLNLAGIAKVFELERENAKLQSSLDRRKPPTTS